MSDLIDRQAVINTEGLDEQIRCEMCRNPMRTDRGCDGNCKYDERLYERIMQILGERINPLSSVQPEPCSDAISRQGAIEPLDIVFDEPTIEERKTGKWINANDGKWNTVEVLKCSVCGEIDNRMYRTDNFCPNCGAKMEEGGQDEQT